MLPKKICFFIKKLENWENSENIKLNYGKQIKELVQRFVTKDHTFEHKFY